LGNDLGGKGSSWLATGMSKVDVGSYKGGVIADAVAAVSAVEKYRSLLSGGRAELFAAGADAVGGYVFQKLVADYAISQVAGINLSSLLGDVALQARVAQSAIGHFNPNDVMQDIAGQTVGLKNTDSMKKAFGKLPQEYQKLGFKDGAPFGLRMDSLASQGASASRELAEMADVEIPLFSQSGSGMSIPGSGFETVANSFLGSTIDWGESRRSGRSGAARASGDTQSHTYNNYGVFLAESQLKYAHLSPPPQQFFVLVEDLDTEGHDFPTAFLAMLEDRIPTPINLKTYNPWDHHTAGDGMTDGFKLLSGLELKEDSDGDGMPDYFELYYGLDPTNPSDASKDDGAGMTAGEKAAYSKEKLGMTWSNVADHSLDPTRPDTDEGGMDDKQEVDEDRNPLDPDDDTCKCG
jgi:hypothetical protein